MRGEDDEGDVVTAPVVECPPRRRRRLCLDKLIQGFRNMTPVQKKLSSSARGRKTLMETPVRFLLLSVHLIAGWLCRVGTREPSEVPND